MAEKEYIEREAFLEQKREQYCKDCSRRKGMRNGKYKTLYEIGEAPCRACEIDDVLNDVEDFPAADVRPVPAGGIGEMSDGYHTFNGLYYQRMVLFAALVKAHKDKAWKSWKHEDGNPCFGGGWFIVGIDTPEGSYTYHYDKMYWNLFECKELPTAKHWDGHTEKDVTRLLSLDVRPVEWIPVTERLPEEKTYVLILFDTIAGKMQGVCFLYKDDDGHNCWTWLDRLGKNLFDIQPTHWMPLPSTDGLNET